MNENSTLYLMMLCQLGQLSQWPVFNRPTQLTQPTQRAQPVIFILKQKMDSVDGAVDIHASFFKLKSTSFSQ